MDNSTAMVFRGILERDKVCPRSARHTDRESPKRCAPPAQARPSRQRGPEGGHTPTRPRHSMPRRECAGRAVASAGASHHPHAASVGRNGATPGGLLLDPTPFRLRGGPEGVRRRERSSPGKGRTAHPEAPRTTPQNSDTPPPRPTNRGWRRRGLRQAPAGLRSTRRRTPPTPTTNRPPQGLNHRPPTTNPAPTPATRPRSKRPDERCAETVREKTGGRTRDRAPARPRTPPPRQHGNAPRPCPEPPQRCRAPPVPCERGSRSRTALRPPLAGAVRPPR